MALDGRELCPHCGGRFKPTGLGNHKRSCKAKFEAAERQDRYAAELLATETQRAFSRLAVRVHPVTVDQIPWLQHSLLHGKAALTLVNCQPMIWTH